MGMVKEAKLDLLSLVRVSIEGGRSRFICNALGYYCLNTSIESRWEARRDLIQYIDNCLGGLATFEDWLCKHHKDLMREHNVTTPSDLVQYALSAKVRQARLDWIDHMIKLVEAGQL